MKLTHHQKELYLNAAVAFGVKLAAAGCNFILSLVLARTLGIEGTGIYYLAFTLATIGATVGKVGLDTLLIRFIAKNAIINKWGVVKGIYNKAIKLAFFASLATSIAVYLASDQAAQNIFNAPQLVEPLQLMAISILPTTLFMLHASALQGIKRVAMSVSVLSLFAPLCTIIFIPFMVPSFGINGAALSYIIAAFITLIIGVFFWHFSTPELRKCSPSIKIESFSSCLPSYFWIGIFQQLNLWMPTLILGALSTEIEVGLYSVASRIAMITLFVMFAVNTIAAPKFAEYYSDSDFISLEKFAQRATLILVLGAGAVFSAFSIFSVDLLSLFGPEFVAGRAVLIVISLGLFLATSSGSVGHILLMCGGERSLRFSVAMAISSNVVVSLLLVPRWGALGAAFSALVSYLVQSILSAHAVHRHYNIQPWAFWRNSR